jgi:hypothetical protein
MLGIFRKGVYMNLFTLDMSVVGEPDGSEEALHIRNFDKYFYHHNEVLTDIYKNKYFIISGRKGSGKTLIAEFIKNDSKNYPEFKCQIKSFKNLLLHKSIQNKNVEVSSEELYSLWKWVILIHFLQNLMIDNTIEERYKQKSKKFFSRNHYSIEIDTKEIVELTINGKIKGSILSQGLEVGQEAKKRVSRYLNYLESLEKEVIRLLSFSKNHYWFFYDELDEKFDNTEDYRCSIKALLEAAKDLNKSLFRNIDTSKIIILIRTDIFSLLNSPNMNKIRQGNTITIDWGTRIAVDSPLLKCLQTELENLILIFQE